jgi:hypothetical protein
MGMERSPRIAVLTLSFIVGSSSACSSNNDMTAQKPDAMTTQMDGGVVSNCPSFDIEVVDGEGANHPRAGDNATLALDSSGNPTVAYGATQKGSTTYQLWYAARKSDGTWTKELVVEPGSHVMPAVTGQITGLGFAQVDGAPQLAYIGGTTDGNPLTPYPTDLMLSKKTGGAWMETTLVTMGSQVTCSCPGTQDYCHFGNVVGNYASMRARPGGGGYAIAYQDSHNGFARDDLDHADADVFTMGGPVMNVCADSVRSGGQFADITYTKDKNVVLAYNLIRAVPPNQLAGVWAAAYDGMNWILTLVDANLAYGKVALGTAPDGTIYMAVPDSGNNNLLVGTSTTNGKTWHTSVVQQGGKTGLAPSIAFDGMGRPIIAFEYCGPSTDQNCPGSTGAQSEVRLVRLEGSTWHMCKVDNGQGMGMVGLFTSTIVTPDGKLGIAYVDDLNGSLLYAKEM